MKPADLSPDKDGFLNPKNQEKIAPDWCYLRSIAQIRRKRTEGVQSTASSYIYIRFLLLTSTPFALTNQKYPHRKVHANAIAAAPLRHRCERQLKRARVLYRCSTL